MAALDVEIDRHPVTGEIQVVIDVGSGIKARLSIKQANELQQTLHHAVGIAEQAKRKYR